MGMISSAAKTLGSYYAETLGIANKFTRKEKMIGGILGIAPNVPSYFIPAYNLATHNGSAEEVKKGEGIRGLLTGSLDGAAVAAIACGSDSLKGKKFTFKTVLMFMAVGASIDFICSRILPPLGEKIGKIIYDRNNKTGSNQQNISINESKGNQSNSSLLLPSINTFLNNKDTNINKTINPDNGNTVTMPDTKSIITNIQPVTVNTQPKPVTSTINTVV